MNDPNGLVLVDGTWHAFYQYNPLGSSWGNMSWGHALSTDLCSWTELPVAIPFGDTEQVYSGSVVVDTDNSSGLADGPNPPLVAVYTSAYADGIQAQALAISNDRGFTWTPFEVNPVLSRQSHGFRDPKVFRFTAEERSCWIMAAVEADARQVLFYSSDNLRDWTFESTFGPLGDPGVVWECPDLFPLPVDAPDGPVRWVLLISTNSAETQGDDPGSSMAYVIGRFDGHRFVPDDDNWRTLDFGPDFYAGTTFTNVPDERRILLGWMNNWRYAHTTPTNPWRGALSTPRELRLRTIDHQIRLTQEPVRELAQPPLPPMFSGRVVSGTPVRLGQGWQFAYRIDWRTDSPSPFGIDLFTTPTATTRLTYDPTQALLTLDRTRSGLVDFGPGFQTVSTVEVPLRDNHLRLDVFGDAGLIEVFADDGATVISSQSFPQDGPPECVLFANDSVSAAVSPIPVANANTAKEDDDDPGGR